MQVICLFLRSHLDRRNALAEACLALSPQIAISTEAVFLEISASHQLFNKEECLQRLQEILQALGIKAKITLAGNIPAALAFARFGTDSRDLLPIEALSDYLNPFAPEPFTPVAFFRQLGIETIGAFLSMPRAEIPARFGKDGLLAYTRILEANNCTWPRFEAEEKILERVDFDFAAQIHSFEPVLFLLKTALHRAFLRLFARRLKLTAFTIKFHLNRFSEKRERINSIHLPLPQSDPQNVLNLTKERLMKELENHPLEDALEGLTLLVNETAPLLDSQKDFFSKAAEEQEAWASLIARLRERLGNHSAFLAVPAPRLLPEASWVKSLNEKDIGICVETPPRPLRLFDPPISIERKGDRLVAKRRHWKIAAFEGPERIVGEWWLGGFAREYYRVETQNGDTLWIFTTPNEKGDRALWLHGIFD